MKQTTHLLTALAATALALGLTSCGVERTETVTLPVTETEVVELDYDNLTPEQEALLKSPPGITYEEGALIIDARTQEEYDEGHLPGATLIPHDTIVEGIVAVAPDKDTKIYVHCFAGVRADIAKKALQAAGYTHVTSLGGVDNASKVTGKDIEK